MDGRAWSDLGRDMAKQIAERVRDPNGWNLAVREVAERLGLDVTRLAFGSVLRETCWSVVDEARKQSRTPEQVQQAVSA